MQMFKNNIQSDQENYHSINIQFSTSKLSWYMYSVYNIKVPVFLGFWYNNIYINKTDILKNIVQ